MAREIASGKIKSSQFTDRKRSIKWHGHCQQKALSNINDSLVTLSIPENYSAEEIHAGCCGMAGSFGFEKEHYDMSIKIGELVLFPEVRKYRAQNMIASSGISCRHQIQEGTRVQAKHPIELLHDALKK
jgi:Fe-S oxidoreductase